MESERGQLRAKENSGLKSKKEDFLYNLRRQAMDDMLYKKRQMVIQAADNSIKVENIIEGTKKV